ncbi:MAG: AAA family ATPase [Xenococcaceae cyanobacterium MO_207.B15]|nr:AAA family ATPase [Xenococcaceae cyanobacterium MO_207.B15]
MQEKAVKIEYLFQEQGVDFELKGEFYLCNIQSRYFYYSPKTGKWRMKGKRPWQKSESPENFIFLASVYVPPGSSSDSTRSLQQKILTNKNPKTKPSLQRTYSNSNSAECSQITQEKIESTEKMLPVILQTYYLEVPLSIAKEVQLFRDLILTGEIDNVSELLDKAGYRGHSKTTAKIDSLNNNHQIEVHKHQQREAADVCPPFLMESYKDEALWNKVLEKISLPTTKAILRQKSQLLNWDGISATVGVHSPPLLRLLLDKIPEIEAAFKQVNRTPVEVKLVICSHELFPQKNGISTKKPEPRELEKDFNNNSQDRNWDDKHHSPTPPRTDYQLTPDQQQALSQLQRFTYGVESFFRLTGYAGTGKSFLITHYIRWLIEESINFVSASPTNKAAKNLKTIASFSGLDIDCLTVAQLLGQQPELDEVTGKELFLSKDNLDWSSYSVIIIDEFSMVNKSDFEDIVKEINCCEDTKVVFVGDSAQLPPVGETEPIVSFSPLIQQGATLTKVVRYDGELARIAEAIRSNSKYSRILFPFQSTSDRSIICLPESEWFDKAHALLKSPEFATEPDLIRFLAWRNQTVESLNHFVRSQLWGENAADYLPGDRLIARRPLFRPKPGAKGRNKWRIIINNSEEAIVTQPGVITSLSFRRQIYKYWKVEVKPDMGKQTVLSILHPDSKKIHRQQLEYFISKKQWSHYYDLSRMFDDVAYAYALTTHKAQGSTIDYVFLDVEDMKGSSDRQKLLYTALTRARKQVLIPH